MAVARSALLQRCQSLAMSRERLMRPLAVGDVAFTMLRNRVFIRSSCAMSWLLEIHANRGPA